MTPHVVVVREGEGGAELFDSLLIDDPDEPEGAPTPDSAGEGGGGSSGGQAAPTGLEHFVQHIRAEVMMQLQP